MGAILSIAAGAAYYVCLILQCCLPRGPDPCFRRHNTESSDMVVERETFDDDKDGDDEENRPHIEQQQKPWADPDSY
jgi:hypothetical protein